MIVMTVSVEWRTYSADCSLQRKQEEFEAESVALKGSRRMESSQVNMWPKGECLFL